MHNQLERHLTDRQIHDYVVSLNVVGVPTTRFDHVVYHLHECDYCRGRFDDERQKYKQLPDDVS